MGIDPVTHEPLQKQETESSSQGSTVTADSSAPISELANCTEKQYHQPLTTQYMWMDVLQDDFWFNFPTWGTEIYNDLGSYSSEDSLNRLLDYYKELGDEDFDELGSLGDFNKQLVGIGENEVQLSSH